MVFFLLKITDEAAADMYMKLNPRVKDTGKVRYLEALKSVFEFLGLAEGEKITIEESVKRARSYITNPEFIKRTKVLFSAVFENLDVDKNGFLSPQEWEAYMASLKFTDPSKGKEIFDFMDLNKDGQLSHEEFVETDVF